MLSPIKQITSGAPSAGLSVKSASNAGGSQVVLPISFPHYRHARPGREMVGIAVHGVSPDEERSDGVSRWQGAGQTRADRLRRHRIPFAPRCAGAMIFAGA
jgi:hypothetical protein